MNGRKIGIWLIGAWGQIGTALTVVLAGLHSRTIATGGLVTEQPEFAGLELAEWSRFVLGGHEIRKTRQSKRGICSPNRRQSRPNVWLRWRPR